jgi:non-specific protein-tyrosine kinase
LNRSKEAAMKLRQALDKARTLGGGEAGLNVIGLRPVRVAEEADWTPPVYSASARVEIDARTLAANRCDCYRSDSPELEHYKVLRAKIQQIAGERRWNAVMITSPRDPLGKSIVAVNLALTFAKAFNQTVMLVDGDLRRQQVHRLLGYDRGVGLVDFLIDRRPLRELIAWPALAGQMTVISGGRRVLNSAELLGSARMRSLVAELKSRYDDRMLLFDAAPVLEGADAIALAALVDGIVIVVADGQTGMQEVKKAIAMLPREKLIGYTLRTPARPSAPPRPAKGAARAG